MNRARVGPWLTVLLIVHGVALAAGVLAPRDPVRQYREFPYAPPSRLRLVDPEGRWHVLPFAHPWRAADGTPAAYVEDRSRLVALDALADADVPVFLLGTDAFGRDQLSRLLHGARLSLFTGVITALLTLAIAVGAGTVAGAAGGWIDRGLTFVTDVLMALPWTYLLLAIRGVLPLDLEPSRALLSMAAVLGLVGWARPGRLVRAVVRSTRTRDFVTAAEAAGAPPAYVMTRHLLPETAAVVLTQLAVLVPRFVLAEVTLSFLGLGIGEPAVSWGTMLAAAQQYDVLAERWWLLAPGVALVPVCYSYHALADALHHRLSVPR